MDRSILEKKILDVLKQNQGRWYKPRTLLRAARIRESEYRALKLLLLELFRAGSIEQKGRNQYAYKPQQQLKTGVLAVTSRGFGFVELKDGSELFIRAQDMGIAFHGDVVRVKVNKRKSGDKDEGNIVEVIKRAQSEYVGVYQFDRYGKWVIPDDKRMRVRFAVDDVGKLKLSDGEVVTVEILSWESGQPEPLVRVKEIIGRPGEPGFDEALIIRQHDLPTQWSQKAIDQALSFSQNDIAAELKNRKDLRALPCFTIDPFDAKDFDDAVSIEKTDKGWRLGVHIADVSHYVTSGSPIDRGARKRGTSVYLVGSAVHMLPEELAADLCSLKPDVERLAMTCMMNFDKSGHLQGHELFPSVIRSHQRFTYEEVEEIIQGKGHKYASGIAIMEKLRQVLFKRRKEKGSIDLDIPEPIISLDEKGFPHDISPSKRLTAHRLVEEFMLAANRVVATFLKDKYIKAKLPGLYRVHETPSNEDANKLKMILQRLNIERKLSFPVRSIDYQQLVEAVRESPFRHFIEKVALRSMTKAKYSVENKGHFGLAFPAYTHFTSPIRRYPDLMVHRLIKMYAGFSDAAQPTLPALVKLAEHCSARERVAIEAERDHIKLKQMQFLSKHVGETFNGVISGALNFGFFVELAESFVEGLVHTSTLKDDYYEYQEQDFALVGRRTRKKYRLGDPVRIKVVSVSVSEGLADFSLVED
jgi:ribonuclease R